ncbi:MAG: ComEC/Rec2 family competence protein [Candidatus Cloacimonetes bacterium]|nr:ComEC/Rec2 family competence protein [Candidatus Cloacimonadota bacterium]
MRAKPEYFPLPTPMLGPVICWTLGILLTRFVQAPWPVLAAIALVLGLVAVLCSRLRTPLILLLFMLLGFLRVQADSPKAGTLATTLSERGSIRQEISFKAVRPLSERAWELRLTSLAGHKMDGTLLLFDNGQYIPGAEYSALADLHKLVNDPLLDIHPTRFEGSVTLVLPAELSSALASLSLRSQAALFITQRLDKLPSGHRDLAKALLLSDPVHKKAQQNVLSKAGLSHLVVVSGLHVLMLYFIIITLLRFFLPWRIADIAFLIIITSFAALNHWAPPITRAILMISLALMAKWLSRPLSAAQNLSVSLFVITLIRPMELFSVGLQLSFTAVSIIVFALPKLHPKEGISVYKRMGCKLLNYVLLSACVGLGILPLTLYYFGVATLNGIFANLLGLPLMAILLGLAISNLAFPIEPLYIAYSFVADVWQWWLNICAGLPLQIQDSWIPATHSLALALILILPALAFKARWKLLKALALPIVAVATLLFVLPVTERGKLIVYNAGTADCSLIFTADGTTIMIDSGGISSVLPERGLMDNPDFYADSWMNKRLISQLRRSGLGHLDYLLITHLHSDHAGGLPTLFRHLDIRHLILSQSALESEDWRVLSPELELGKTRIIAVSDTFSIPFGSQMLKILHPDQDYTGTDANNLSIVCRFDDGRDSYLFTGDIEADAEAYLTEKYPEELRARILKVPHHGSRSSSSKAFLDAVNAQEAWISCADT